jgi:hypothetical protein
MSFSVKITRRQDTNGARVHSVIVTIDGHETLLAGGLAGAEGWHSLLGARGHRSDPRL